MTTDIIVIDVSHWQGNWPGPDTPWEAMTKTGIVGVILKATEGTSYVDDTYQRRYQACREHNVAVCSYHYLKHGNIEQQMEHFINTVSPDHGERLVLDWEDPAVTFDEIQDACAILLNTLDDGEPADLQVTVYGSSSFLMDHVPNEYDPLLERTSLWVARYSNEQPYWPEKVWKTWSLWQCTDKHYIEDYGPVDGNRFNGSVENCIKWLKPAI
jgi:lysozyme